MASALRRIQLFDIRVAPETLAIRTAVRDASDADLARLGQLVPTEDDGDLVSNEQATTDDLTFHLTVSDISGNRYLHTMVQAVRGVFSEAFPIPVALWEDLDAIAPLIAR